MRKLFIGLSILLYLSCDDVFQTHPYDVNIKGEKNLNAKNMAIIEEAFANKNPLRVAFISDNHLWQSDFRDEISDLNKRTDVDFVVHCGDLTDTGTNKEFEWSRDILCMLNHPFVVLIGNHDFLGTGDQAYDVIYGEKNFSFIANRIKFVCINTNATEYNYMAAVPDFNFMEEEMVKDADRFDRTIIIMHAPPYSDQFPDNVVKAFRRYLDFFPGLICCVYGHVHRNEVKDIYNDGLLFYGIDSAEGRNYRIFTFTADGYETEQIDY